MEYTVTFFTHSGAIKFERLMKQKCMDVTLMPVPRKLSSNCGIAAKINFQGDIRDILTDEIEKIFSAECEKTILVYDSDMDIDS
jgi:hypothetical protein